ncbi:MAG: RluA family pseudouridine synthase [Anaerolineae bacterium]
MMTGQIIRLLAAEGGQRLDKYIVNEISELSRSMVQRLIKEGRVTVGGEATKPSYPVQEGDEIVVRVPPPEPTEVKPEAIPLDIVYEDEDIIVVNKPAGMVVHPAYGHRTGTLVNAILAHCPGLAGIEGDGSTEPVLSVAEGLAEVLRPGIVHRLDKDTSGLIIVAKNDSARRHLQHQFKRREVKKVYVALLEGRLEPARGVIEAPIGRDKKRRRRMAVVEGGREARTEYRVVEYFGDKVSKVSRPYTLVEAEPKTGRTHQVRVHFASIGHPLAGDSVYGFRKQRLSDLRRQFLHARTLGFRLPGSDEYIELSTDLPDDLRVVLEELRRSSVPR